MGEHRAVSVFTWDLRDGTEPCDECDRGLIYVLNYEGRRLCQNCMDIDIEEKGLDEMPQSWLPKSATATGTYIEREKRSWYVKKADRALLEETCEYTSGCLWPGACYGKLADNTGPRCKREKQLF